MSVCNVCLDGLMPPKGVIACPKCGTDFSKSVTEVKPQLVLSRTPSDDTVVPQFYQGVFWSDSVFESTHGNLLKTRTLPIFLRTIGGYIERFRNGGLPDRSLLLTAPSGFGKKIFAYTCMQLAEQAGHTVAPLYDIFEVKRILDLGMVKQNQRNSAWALWDYEKYLSAEVVFVTIPSERMHWYCASVIQDLLQKRARLNLATIIISRYRVSAMSQGDSGEFQRFCDKAPPFNPYERPSLVTLEG